MQSTRVFGARAGMNHDAILVAASGRPRARAVWGATAVAPATVCAAVLLGAPGLAARAGLLCRGPGAERRQSRSRPSGRSSPDSWRRPRLGWPNWMRAWSRVAPPSQPGKGCPPCGWGPFLGCYICNPGFKRGSGGYRRERAPGRLRKGHFAESPGCRPRLNWWLWIGGGQAGMGNVVKESRVAAVITCPE